MPLKQKLYFAYGSNLLRKQMQERCPRAHYVGIASAKGWQFEYDGGKGEDWSDLPVGNIIPKRHGRVWGALYWLSPKDLKNLDSFEHVPKDYRHKTIEVRHPHGKPVKALAYVRPARPTGEPSKHYRKVVIMGAEQDSLPEDYIDSVLAV